jgi:hypothetical protein
VKFGATHREKATTPPRTPEGTALNSVRICGHAGVGRRVHRVARSRRRGGRVGVPQLRNYGSPHISKSPALITAGARSNGAATSSLGCEATPRVSRAYTAWLVHAGAALAVNRPGSVSSIRRESEYGLAFDSCGLAIVFESALASPSETATNSMSGRRWS